MTSSSRTKNAVSQLGNLEAGELLLGSGPYPAARLVPQAMGKLAKAYPRVRINLLIDNWRGLRTRLLNDDLELFVADIRDLEDDPLLQIEALSVHKGVICCRPDHPLTRHDRVTKEEIFAYPIAATQAPSGSG